MAMQDPRQRRSTGARIGLVMLAGAIVVLAGLVILIFNTTAGVTVMILGALLIMAAPLPVVLAEAPAKPKPGERPPVKYGSNELGWVFRAMDPTWDKPTSPDDQEPPS